MALTTTAPGVGGLLRGWRQQRRLSQLDLANEAAVSARHLSFVETGRSRPSRELVLHLAERLEVPLRERNTLLLAAGYAPSYARTPLEAEEMAPVREALDRILAGHEPFPAIVVDRYNDVVTANASALAIMSDGVAAHLLEPPVNALRVTVHPDGLAPRIVNFGEYATHLVDRLRREIATHGDEQVRRPPRRAVHLPGGGRVAVADRHGRRAVRAAGAAHRRGGAHVLLDDRHLRHGPRHHGGRAVGRVVLPGRRGHDRRAAGPLEPRREHHR